MSAWLKWLWRWFFPPPPPEALTAAWGRHLDAEAERITLTVAVLGADRSFAAWVSDLIDELGERGHTVHRTDDYTAATGLLLLLVGPGAVPPFPNAEDRWAWMMPRRGRTPPAIAAVAATDADADAREAAADLVRLTPGGRRTDDDLIDWSPDELHVKTVADALAAFAHIREARC